MTDKELLELAAKAIGKQYPFIQKDRGGRVWEPHLDDGDALRLALMLGMTIGTHAMGIYVKDATQKMLAAHPECTNAGQRAAVRRTIVRAAAEIGKSLP